MTRFVELGPGTVLTGMAKRTVSSGRTLSVGSPAELDQLLEELTHSSSDVIGLHEGEHLFTIERVVVSPASGVFHPAEGVDTGHELAAGEVLGTVGDETVWSPFAGTIMGMLTDDGERVTAQEPIAWLRAGG